MTRRTVLISAAALSLAALAAAPILAPLKAPPRPDELSGPMEPLNYFLGSWEIDGQWMDGRAIRARNDYRVGVAGKFLEATTTASDQGSDPYERYFTVFAHDAQTDTFTSYGFTYDGTAATAEFELGDGENEPLISSEWSANGMHFRQSVTPIDDDSYNWKVWVQPPNADWRQIMHGVWRRTD